MTVDIFKDFAFPVAICIVLILAICYLHKEHKADMQGMKEEYKADMQKVNDSYQTTIREMTETHSKEMKEVIRSVNRLSDSIDNLIQSLKG